MNNVGSYFTLLCCYTWLWSCVRMCVTVRSKCLTWEIQHVLFMKTLTDDRPGCRNKIHLRPDQVYPIRTALFFCHLVCMLVTTNVKFHSEVMLFPHFPDWASLLELLVWIVLINMHVETQPSFPTALFHRGSIAFRMGQSCWSMLLKTINSLNTWLFPVVIKFKKDDEAKAKQDK